jgi:sugar/nucleoside kinase (ribokinase family)
MNDNGRELSDVVIIGDVLLDYQYWVDEMPKHGGDAQIIKMQRNFGGSAANSAIALAALQVAVSFCGRIGNDEYGSMIRDRLESFGGNCSLMQYGEATGYTLTFIDKLGERTMFSFRGAAGEQYEESEDLVDIVRHAKLLLISGYLLTNAQQAEFVLSISTVAKRSGCIVALDVAPTIEKVPSDIRQRMLLLTDILFPNQRELSLLCGTEDILLALRRINDIVPCIAVKKGAGGACLQIKQGFSPINGKIFVQDVFCEVDATDDIPIDTTGAGDAFNAGFLASFLKHRNPQKWLEDGNRLAGKVVSRQGAVSLFTSDFKWE